MSRLKRENEVRQKWRLYNMTEQTRRTLCSSFRKMLFILIGCFLYAAGIGLFLDPNKLAPGGVVGISVILSHSLGGETGTWYFLLNIPIILLGWWKFGGRFIINSFYAIALNSIFTNIFSIFPAVTNNTFLAAVAGSLLVGSGLGLVLKTGATTGGMDIVIKILRRKYPAIKTSTYFVTIDLIIVAISGFIFRDFNCINISCRFSVTKNGTRKILPIVERMVFGLKTSTVVRFMIIPLIPAPSPVRNIVPKLPGS